MKRYIVTGMTCAACRALIQMMKWRESTMTKTLKIEGMMCEHCEARVKKALEAVAGDNL